MNAGYDGRSGPHHELSPRAVTISEVLRTAGYQTAMVGKWDSTGHQTSKRNWPLQRGFERFYGTLAGAGSYFDPTGLTAGNAATRPDRDDFYYTDAISDRAVQFINEFSEKSKTGIILYEEDIPIPIGVGSACDMLGIDPLEIGNEGKVVLGVVKEKAEDVLSVLKKHPLGKNAAIIGEATNEVKGVVLQTLVGGKRILHKPLGDPVPRIC